MVNTDKTLIMKYNIDSQGNTMAVKIDNEQKQISPIHYCVQLSQVPDEQYRMIVMDDTNNELIEVFNMDEIKENNYYINYTSSVVYFHPSKASKVCIFNYYGLGIELISASRIYDESSISGQFIIKTIQEIIDKGRECIEALSTIGDAVKLLQRIENYIIVATELDIKLREDIATGNQLVIDLNNTIEIGSQLNTDLGVTINTANTSKAELETTTTNANNKKVELEGTISTANTSKTNLENTTATADAKKTELDTSIANAQDDINTINSAGNRTFTIPSTAWVGTEPDLSYILEHNLGGENLIVGAIDNETKLSNMPDYKSIDSMKIELYSTTRRNVTVTINKSAYTGSDSEWVSQEVIDARKGEVSLKSKIDGIDSQLADINNKQNFVNVLDYGAKCDGVTDDSVAFQNALNELNTHTTTNGQWKRTIYIPAKMRITSKISVNFGQFTIEGNGVTNSIVWFDGSEAGLEIGDGLTTIHEIEFKHVYIKGNDTNTNILKFNKVFNILFNRFHISNWGENQYGIKFIKSGIIFFTNECILEGGADITTNTANRNLIYLDNLDSMLNIRDCNIWNLNKLITCDSKINNLNILDSWIECVRTMITVNCISNMTYTNIKIRGNLISAHNISGIVYSTFGFVIFNTLETTDLFGSNIDINDNTIYLWDITGITNNSLISIPSMVTGSDVFITFDNNVISGKSLSQLGAYVFYSPTSAMSIFVHIMSCNLTRKSDYQNICNYISSIKGLTLNADKKLTAPNGIYLSSYQTTNNGNIFYENGNFYGGYEGVVKTIPKSSGVTITNSTASDVTTLKNDLNTLLSALRTAKIIN